MFSLPYVNTLTWADILFEELRPKTGGRILKTTFVLAKYFIATLFQPVSV